jgi:amino acid transporter
LVIAVLGVLRIRVNTRVLAVVLTAEILLIVLFDAAAFANPAEGFISLTPLTPNALFVDGVGGVLALGIAAFIGYEVGPVYAEEVRGRRVVARASFATIIFIGLFYTVSSWAMAVAFGPTDVIDAARNPDSGIPFSVLEQFYGPLAALLANLLLITSIFAAMLSFHHSVARYVFALSREKVLPPVLDHIGPGSGAPIGGSLIQSTVALIVVGAFAIAGADPIIQLFAWLSTLAAIGVLVLMVATSLAVVVFFHRGNGTDETAWQRAVAPTLGGFALLAILVVSVVNLSSVLGVEPTSPLTWILPGIIGVSALVGLIWGVVLSRVRPRIYNNIGRGQPRPLAVLEHSLADIEV